VVVVGDIGRSPRMCNHAVSLAEEDYDVTLMGHCQSQVRSDVAAHPRIRLKHMPTYKLDKTVPKIPRLLNYALKVLWQTVIMWFALPLVRGPDVILLQNPPGIPALLVCYFYSLLHRTRFVIDWHNYGFSIMALSLGEQHLLVRISRRIEEFVGRRVSRSFCVSEAMKRDLADNMGVTEGVTVLYDRPGKLFKPCTASETQELFSKLAESYPDAAQLTGSDRSALLVSSTSWTEDEDFSVLLEALQAYEDASSADPSRLPRLLCVITGKGPLKEHYCRLVSDQGWSRVAVVTPWLEPDDYPRVLASADLGVCLHTSSSGVDLPMKVVDMFGCGLPVAALRFPAIGELVRDGVNGRTFGTQADLADVLTEWFEGHGSEEYLAKAAKFRAGAVDTFGPVEDRWEANWKKVALPLIAKD